MTICPTTKNSGETDFDAILDQTRLIDVDQEWVDCTWDRAGLGSRRSKRESLREGYSVQHIFDPLARKWSSMGNNAIGDTHSNRYVTDENASNRTSESQWCVQWRWSVAIICESIDVFQGIYSREASTWIDDRFIPSENEVCSSCLVFFERRMTM